MNKKEEFARKEAELDRKQKEFNDYYAQVKQEFNSYVHDADAIFAKGDRIVQKIEAGEEIDQAVVQPAGESNTDHHDSAWSCCIL